jgi:hypothetical protein
MREAARDAIVKLLARPPKRSCRSRIQGPVTERHEAHRHVVADEGVDATLLLSEELVRRSFEVARTSRRDSPSTRCS